jgi:hypothetical protein
MASTKKSPAKKSPAKAATKKTPAKKTPAKTATKKSPAKKHAMQRADYGAPIEGFFAKQPPALRPIVDGLRALITEVAPSASASLKWGMPFYELDGAMLCAIGAHKSHVNLILSGPPGTFADPKGLLTGEGKTGKHLKLTPGDAIPTAAVRGWLRAAAKK